MSYTIFTLQTLNSQYGVAEYVGERRSAAGDASIAANGLRAVEHMAKLTRGKRNPNKGTISRNAAVRDLGEEVGAFVMGQDEWAVYIETSVTKMPPLDKPLGYKDTIQLAQDRPSGARDGWKFDHAEISEPRWAMTDKIFYRLPNHTAEAPDLRDETFQAAISDAYHHHWTLHLRLLKRNKKDEKAGKELPRGRRK